MKKPKNSEPQLTAAARAILKARIRVHPEAAKFVKSSEQVSAMRKAELMAVARSLHIDVGEVVQQAQQNPKATGIDIEFAAERAEGPAFSGAFEFDLEMAALGDSFTRTCRVSYEHTPEWTYFKPETGSERLGRGSSTFKLEVLAVLERESWESVNGKIVKRRNKPYWTEVEGLLQDGVLPESLMDKLFDRIDDESRLQDARNRAAAKKRRK